MKTTQVRDVLRQTACIIMTASVPTAILRPHEIIGQAVFRAVLDNLTRKAQKLGLMFLTASRKKHGFLYNTRLYAHEFSSDQNLPISTGVTNLGYIRLSEGAH